MEGTIAQPENMLNTEPDKNESWLWVEEAEIESWIAAGERVFQPLVNYYRNKSKRHWSQGSVHDHP